MKRREFLKLSALSAVATAFRPQAAMAAADDLRAIAHDGWLYVLPLLTMAATRARMLANAASPTPRAAS